MFSPRFYYSLVQKLNYKPMARLLYYTVCTQGIHAGAMGYIHGYIHSGGTCKVQVHTSTG